MPQQSQVCYYVSRNAYYTQFQGKKHLLAKGPDDYPDGPTYKAALKAFGQLMASGAIEKDGDENQVQAILEKYMQNAQRRLRASGFTSRMYVLKPFQQALGAVLVGELTHFMVEEFIAQQRQPRKFRKRTVQWGDSTVAYFLRAANAAFNWARKRKLITANPLEGFQGPKPRSRSRDCLITPDDYQRILADCRYPTIRNLIVALEATGARPSELIAAKTTDWDDELGAIVYYADDRRRVDDFRHKNARYKDRFICFTGEALEMVRGLIRTKAPGSLLFLSARGRPLQLNYIVRYFLRARKRLGLPKLTAYSFRHTFATNWLVAGKSIELLGEILGNTPETIRKHYAHLCGHRHAIRDMLEEFRREQKSCTPGPQTDDSGAGSSAQSA